MLSPPPPQILRLIEKRVAFTLKRSFRASHSRHATIIRLGVSRRLSGRPDTTDPEPQPNLRRILQIPTPSALLSKTHPLTCVAATKPKKKTKNPAVSLADADRFTDLHPEPGQTHYGQIKTSGLSYLGVTAPSLIRNKGSVAGLFPPLCVCVLPLCAFVRVRIGSQWRNSILPDPRIVVGILFRATFLRDARLLFFIFYF